MRTLLLVPTLTTAAMVATAAFAAVPTVPPPVYDGNFIPCGEGLAANKIIEVPTERTTIAEAVAIAQDGDTVRIAPGVYELEASIPITKNITICAEYPPREVYDGPAADIVDDTIMYISVDAPLNDVGFQGAFVVQNAATLTFENIRFKMPESLCGDKQDNDGNGLIDADDPGCFFQVVDDDTAADPQIIASDDPRLELRGFFVQQDSSLILRNSEFIGWSWSTEGNVVSANNPLQITIRNSRFISNQVLLQFTENGDYIRSRGTIYTRSGVIDIRNTFFDHNIARFGGVLYATDGAVITLADNAFTENEAEDGGVIWAESSTVSALRNFFVANGAVRVPKREVIGVVYEGGAIWAEDCALEIVNNVFLENTSRDWAAAIMARRSIDGATPPQIINNTFIENLPELTGGAAVMIDEAQFVYKNNISVNEVNGAIGAQNWTLGRIPNVNYNDFFGVDLDSIYTAELSGLAVERSTNIFTDPMFVYWIRSKHTDWRLWRFWLDQLSPAIDAGNPTVLDVGGSRSDVGAYGGAQSGTVDEDSDGWTNIYDCDDQDDQIFPYAFEECDDIDNDCNGVVDDRERVFFLDKDLDGYGADPSVGGPRRTACPNETLPTPVGGGFWVEQGGDCDDTTTLVNPGRNEFCDGADNDCNGEIDDNIDVRPHYVDFDQDGFGDGTRLDLVQRVKCPNVDPSLGNVYSPFNTDCNDRNPDLHPLIDEEARTHLPLANETLERHEADRDPQFVADGIDQDCDGVDLCYPDSDGDGVGERPAPGDEPTYVVDNDKNCRNLSAQTAAVASDCDDGDASVFPNAVDLVGDGIDGNCDGKELCYQDVDGDGYGTTTIVEDNNTDCDDGSGPTASSKFVGDEQVFDCDDNDIAVFPGANSEICDGLDNNCNGEIDEVTSDAAKTYYRDADNDGYGGNEVIQACAFEGAEPPGYASRPGDCDDNNPEAFPGNQEVCGDGFDNNCANGIDESSASNTTKFYEDIDADRFIDPDIFTEACTAPDEGGPWVAAGDQLGVDCDNFDINVGACLCGASTVAQAPRNLGWIVVAMLLGFTRRRRDLLLS